MNRLIIGNMTGNSMDAIDLILTKFDGNKMEDICSFSMPYSTTMQNKIEQLRDLVKNKTKEQILKIENFTAIHDEYISQIARAIQKMCEQYNIDKNNITAIGFHGKTLDHNPPSRARINNTLPYTLQIGSGKMLADLTQLKVVYDFRSAPLMAGFEAAPLIGPHNAHIAQSEGSAIFFNGGNTSNFAIIENGKVLISSDAGPCNEYTDNFIRQQTDLSFDENGKLGQKGKINLDLFNFIYHTCQDFFETKLPKSGDPAYYSKDKIFDYAIKQKINLNDTIRTFEYFAAYIAAFTLTLVPNKIKLPSEIVLFGGGWKNPIVKQAFADILSAKGLILPQHAKAFAQLQKRFSTAPTLCYSKFSDFMEARLCADMANSKLENKPWELPEALKENKQIVCGVIAEPLNTPREYDDMINLAAKGWQDLQNRI